MRLLTTEQLEALIHHPVPGENPGGVNVRLEAAFESVERQIAKLDSLTAGDPVRWSEVLQTSHEILQHQSKDFLVVCYLARALCEVDVIAGLQQGLALAGGITEHFWEHAIPPVRRARGRAQAFEWLVEKTLPLMEQCPLTTGHLEKIKALETTLVALDSTLMEKMADAAPNLAEFRQRIRRMRQSLEVEQQAHVQRAESSRPQTSPVHNEVVTDNRPESLMPAPAVPVVSSAGSDRDVTAVYRAVQDPLRSVSRYLREKKLTDPEAYRINRFTIWLGISQLPPATENRTQLKPVPRDRINACQAMLAEQQWQVLLPELENSLSKAPYWLDGHRWVWEALQALQADDAATIVRDGVRGFVTRFPSVVQLQFSDGTPFADEKTRRWIQHEVGSSHQAAVNSSVMVDTSGISSRWQDAYEQACILGRDKKFRDAMLLFQEGCAQSISLREQALWRFNQARFCYEHQLLGLALPLLENLDQQLSHHKVDEWEPQITTRILELLLRCYRRMDSAEVPQKKLEVLHARLCRLDLALAFDLSSH